MSPSKNVCLSKKQEEVETPVRDDYKSSNKSAVPEPVKVVAAPKAAAPSTGKRRVTTKIKTPRNP